MKAIKSNKRAKDIIERLRNTFDERSGIHLSDLIHPMKAYWSKTLPKKPTDDETLYFIAGKAHEGLLLGDLPHSDDMIWNDIYYSPDAIINGEPVEIKTRRFYKEGEIPEHYINQLKGYCVCMGTNKGWLWIFDLTKKFDYFQTKPDLTVFRVIFTEDELIEHRDKLKRTYRDLVWSIGHKDCTRIPYCEEWMCATKKKILAQPAKCLTCQTELKANQVKKHLRDNPDCEGVSMPVYEEELIPKCRWYTECKGAK